MNMDDALTWAAQRKHAVMITIRSDGRPQSSDVVYAVDEGRLVVSLTNSRAKTANLRRDPRAVMHLTSPESWSYVSFDGTFELSPVTTSPGDATSDALVAYFEAVAGEAHSDWAEYRQAMIDEGRLLGWFTPAKAIGQING